MTKNELSKMQEKLMDAAWRMLHIAEVNIVKQQRIDTNKLRKAKTITFTRRQP